MSANLARTADGWWVVTPAGLVRLGLAASTTAELLADRAVLDEAVQAAQAAAAAAPGDAVPGESAELLSPVTAPARVVAQAVNYRRHARESGFGDDPPAVFFRKSSGSISGPTDDIVRPAHVRLLDYEIELGLVIRRGPVAGTTVGDADLPDHVAGLVMCNDISARDVQLTQGQFYESKSYPTFTPTGPRLVLLEADDFARLSGLRLRLWVNGELRQDGTAAAVNTGPVAALSTLASFPRLDPGDLVLTGTPGGTALQAPPAVVAKLGDLLLPTPLKWRAFFSRQERNPAYLKVGDIITASIASEDGALDLGSQRTMVRDAAG
jgi:2-keto-4-pentenoate hydratase/2-oxohepta-3-ene-1,7-dioic acid hydratase in catechol pathway